MLETMNLVVVLSFSLDLFTRVNSLNVFSAHAKSVSTFQGTRKQVS